MPDGGSDYQRDYLLRLPLPLAQLYSRAYNAKDPRGRHDNGFYLCEALVKLLVSPAAACYLAECRRGQARNAVVDRTLTALALPSLGQWVGMLRELARHFAARVDAPSHPLGGLQAKLTQRRADRSALTALYRRIKNGPDGAPAGDTTCSVLELFDALVPYRNGVFGHGGNRFEAFYADDLGPLLFPALNELLSEGTLEIVGPTGARLAYITELRTLDDGRTQVGLWELVGLQGERAAPLELPAEQARELLPNRVVALWPGRALPLRLDPLLQYRESDLAEEVLFLNRDRNTRQVEYLSYTTGRTERDRAMQPAMAALLSDVAGRTIDEADLQQLAERSLAETPSLEALLGPTSTPAQTIGDYELLAELGRGAMGVVYLTRQLSLGRLVALKMLPTDLAADDVALARFRREIRHLARCDHPHIVKVLGSGTAADGRLYYAMEYVPGSDLEQVWRELAEKSGSASTATLGTSTWARAVHAAGSKARSRADGSRSGKAKPGDDAPRAAATETSPLPPFPELPIDLPESAGDYVRRVVMLVRDTARALQVVHDQGIVHRDVKPANLMITPDGGRVVLMDFGLAKGHTQHTMAVSQSGGFLGTLRYAAPEQLAAAKLKVGPQADIRALGVTLWELLTRRRLFAEAEDEAALAAAVYDRDVPRLRELEPGFDRDLEAITARACERRTSDRIATAGQLADYLQLWLDGKPLPIRTPGLGELARRWVRERKAQAASITTAAVLVIAVTAAAFALINRAREEAITAKADAVASEQNAIAAKEGAIRSEQDANAARKSESEKLRALKRETAKLAFHWGVTDWDAGRLFEGELSIFRAYLLSEEDDPDRPSLLRILFDRLKVDRSLQLRHTEKVWVASFSPDGTRILTASLDKTARLWDAVTGRPLGEPMRHDNSVAIALFSPDGSQVVTVSVDKKARVWDAMTGKPLEAEGTRQTQATRLWDAITGTPSGSRMLHDGLILAVSFSRDGKRIVTASYDKTARIWDAATGKQLGVAMRHDGEVRAATFSPDGTHVVTASYDKTARIWDAATNKQLGESLPHDDQVRVASFSPDGTRIVTASEDATARIWDAATGKLIGEPLRHGRAVWAASFSPDGTRVVTASHDKTARIWDAATGKPLGEPLRHDDEIVTAQFSPDGTRIVTASDDKTARIWDTATGKQLGEPLRHSDFVWTASFSPDGTRVATASADQTARIWDLTTSEQIYHDDAVRLLSFSPDGTRVITTAGSTTRVCDAATEKPLGAPLKHGDLVRSASYSPDGKRLVTISWEKTANLWDAQTGKAIGTPLRHDDSINSAAFSPDGTRVVTVSRDKTARLWDAETGKALGKPMRHGDVIRSASFSLDGKRIVTASDDMTAQQWDATSGKPLGAPLRHRHIVQTAQFSPDGTYVVSASNDATARVWIAATGEPLEPPLRHENGVAAASFSPDGKNIVTASSDKTARVWDAVSRRPTTAPLRHDHYVVAASFSPDGTRIVTASWDKTARLWDRTTGKQLGEPLRHDKLLSSLPVGKQDEQLRFNDMVTAACFSPDGTRIVTDSTNSTLRVWDVRLAPRPHEWSVWIDCLLGGVVETSGGRPFTPAELEDRRNRLYADTEWLTAYRAYRESIITNAREQLAHEAAERAHKRAETSK